jgi:ATP-dependent RNA helicase RhlB
MEFTELKLHPDLQRGIVEAGYLSCMPVQEQVFTHAFGGQDLYVQSQTGTGKTAAFLVVIFQRLLAESLLSGKKALIMVPTRELAVQVEDEAKLLGKYLPFKIGSFYGGVGYTDQQRLLKDNAQILVGTPGRVLDLNASGKMNLMNIAFLILDEADRMFDMGFYPDLRKLIKVVPPADRRQTMLFSATLNNWVKNLAWEYTKSPYEIEIAPENVTVEEIEQLLYHVPSENKMRVLLGILAREQPESAIIFCNTKRYAEIVAKRLRLNGIDCEFIMGDLPQSKRLKIIDDVKAGKTRFLVATDVAARGLDIEALAMVVNYDLPVETENYVHRIGRTARAGKSGKAITLVSEQDVYELPAIERYLGRKIPAETVTEDLLGEDKSKGMRVKTDFYEAGRSDSRSSASSSKRRPPDKSRERGRPASHGEKRSGGRNRAEGRGQDVANLSFDERMAYYKRKYNRGENQSEAPLKGAATGGNRGKDGRKRGNRGQGRSAESAGKRGGAAKPGAAETARPSGRARRDKAVTSGGNRADGQRQSAADTTPVRKQGLLDRFLGIFKQNKRKE